MNTCISHVRKKSKIANRVPLIEVNISENNIEKRMQIDELYALINKLNKLEKAVVLWVICFEGVTGVPLWLSILKIVIFLAILYGSTASSLKKMKKIEESFKEYKEFMEKEI